MTTLNHLSVGDSVLVTMEFIGEPPRAYTRIVTKMTDTTITTDDGKKWYIADGRCVPRKKGLAPRIFHPESVEARNILAWCDLAKLHNEMQHQLALVAQGSGKPGDILNALHAIRDGVQQVESMVSQA